MNRSHNFSRTNGLDRKPGADWMTCCLPIDEVLMIKTRRTFLMTVAAGSAALGSSAQAQAVKLDEKDPQAVGLGYAHDASKVDTKKWPKYAKGQVCANCALFQAKGSDPWGGCPLFGTKQVAAKGWCNAWAKKG